MTALTDSRCDIRGNTTNATVADAVSKDSRLNGVNGSVSVADMKLTEAVILADVA